MTSERAARAGQRLPDRASAESHPIYWWRTSFGEDEVQELREAVQAEHISQGPVTEKFEEKFAASLEVPYAVATTSGSVALLLAMMALGIGRDDEVIVPDRTWIAAAHAALMLGAKVVLVDVSPNIPVIDAAQIRQKITSRTKAIVPVHINGRSAQIEEVRTVADECGLLVIEDACQGLYSRNASGFLGTQSDVGCFSLGVTKLVSTGQGGVLVTSSEDTYEKLKLARNHGVVDNFTNTWDQMGFNFKFTDLLASFGLVQLSKARDRLEHLRRVYERYASAMAEFEFRFLGLIPVDVENGEVPLYVEVLCTERERLVAFLESQGIQTRRLPPSLHSSRYLDSREEFPNSARFAEQGLYLPCGPEQPLANVDRVIEALRLYGQRR